MMLTKLRMNIIDVIYTIIDKTDIKYVTVTYSTFNILQERFDNPINLFQKFHNLNSFITITPPH